MKGHLERAQTARGETIIVASAPADRLVFVLDGQLTIERGEIAIGVLGPGDHFGTESVLGPRTHPASVRTQGCCTLLALPAAGFDTLTAAHPDVALALLRGLLAGALRPPPAARARSLVTEGSLPRVASVSVTVEGQVREVPVGMTYGELLPQHRDQRRVVAALVDEKASSLSSRVSSPVKLRALTLAHWEGQRIYRQSLTLLALEAAKQLEPQLCIKAGPSVGFGRRLLAAGLDGPELERFAARLEGEMLALSERGATLREELWTVDEARQHFQSSGFSEAEQLLATWQEPAVPLVSYGSVYALGTLPLLPDLRELQARHGTCSLPRHDATA